MGRSGSTLVERLLGELPGVCSLGEAVHMWRRALVDGEPCGCGAPFGECGFWRDVGEAAFGGWDRIDAAEVLALKASVDRTRFVPSLLGARPPARMARRLADYTALYHRVYAAAAQVSGCRVIVDSSKHASLAACLRHRYGPRLHLVHMLRDPQAVARAWGKRVPRPDATATSPEQEMARYSPGRAAVQWAVQNEVLARVSRLGVPTLRVRYEDFVADPAGEFAALAEFAGHAGELPVDAAGTARLSPAHTVSGNPMRFDSGTVRVSAGAAPSGAVRAPGRIAVSVLTRPSRPRFGY
ncbi:sulfotransferase [Streptomonospora salina]|nr:sulfotransferase [Streptomonospora salina]